MSWSGKSVGVYFNNTCTIDNGLSILHLAYKENRTSKNADSRTLKIQVTDAREIPDNFYDIDVNIRVAGRKFTKHYDTPQKNQKWEDKCMTLHHPDTPILCHQPCS